MTPYRRDAVQKAKHLRKLRLMRVSLVPIGANEAARVVLFKAADPAAAQHGRCRNAACRARIAAGVKVCPSCGVSVRETPKDLPHPDALKQAPSAEDVRRLGLQTMQNKPVYGDPVGKCGACDGPVYEGADGERDPFCRSCGSKLTAKAAPPMSGADLMKCPSCKRATVQSEDAFCRACGARLEGREEDDVETKANIFQRIEALNSETQRLIEKARADAPPKRPALAEIMERLSAVSKAHEPTEADVREVLNGDRELYQRYREEATAGGPRVAKSGGAVVDAVLDGARRLPRPRVLKREDHDAVARIFKEDPDAYAAYRRESYAGSDGDDAA